jgi:hypothetical protein
LVTVRPDAFFHLPWIEVLVGLLSKRPRHSA